MMHLADCEFYWGRFVPVEETLQGLARVRPRDVRRVSERYLKSKPLCAAAVGPLPQPLSNYVPETL
jgi:hypothetical protein